MAHKLKPHAPSFSSALWVKCNLMIPTLVHSLALGMNSLVAGAFDTLIQASLAFAAELFAGVGTGIDTGSSPWEHLHPSPGMLDKMLADVTPVETGQDAFP